MAEIHVRDPRITGLSLNIDDPDDLTGFDMTVAGAGPTPTYAQHVQQSPTFGIVSAPNTSAPYVGGGSVIPSVSPYTPPPLQGYDFLDVTTTLLDPCAGGHVADPKHTEISEDDGEILASFIVTKCIGCGAKIIVERVPGGIPALQLKLFVGSVMGLDLDIEDEDFNVSEMLGALKTLKEAIEREDDALKRAKSLVALGEKILRKKVDEHSVRASD